jgi:TPR repeat protein
MMQSNVQHVAAGLAAAVRDQVAQEAEELCESGQCAAAVVPLQRAIDWGNLPSRALMAWLLIHGREGVAKDRDRAFELVAAGARLGCHHCQGVMALCYKGHGHIGYGCELNEARSLELALESAGKGSRYGQTRSACCIRMVKEDSRRMMPKRLRFIGWLQRRALMRHSASSAASTPMALAD